MYIKVKTIELENWLNVYRAKALPFATRNTINLAAKLARHRAIQNVDNKMILRNTWTKRSIQARYTRSRKIAEQISRVGSIAAYMKTQEFGGEESAKGQGVVIPTPAASKETGRVRRKLPRGQRRFDKLLLSGRFFLAKGKKAKRGIYERYGRKKARTARLIYAMNQKKIKIPANPWLLPASNSVNTRKLYLMALRKELRYLKKL